jgi:regulator of sigma E protease
VGQLIIVNGLREVVVSRDGRQVTIDLPADIEQEILSKGKRAGSMFTERYPAQVDTVVPESAADQAGLKKNDKFISVNGRPAAYLQDLVTLLGNNKGSEVSLEVERDNEVVTLKAMVSEDGKLGFGNVSPLNFIDTEKRTYGFFESIPAGISEGTGILVNYVKSLQLLFSSEGAKQVGGFISIGGLFDSQWNWERFWNMTALLSIILAVMNILPIPALDGGHVMFLLYEMIAGREPNPKFMEYAQLAGLAILVTLLLYANGMDVFRWWSAP